MHHLALIHVYIQKTLSNQAYNYNKTGLRMRMTVNTHCITQFYGWDKQIIIISSNTSSYSPFIHRLKAIYFYSFIGIFMHSSDYLEEMEPLRGDGMKIRIHTCAFSHFPLKPIYMYAVFMPYGRNHYA